MLTNVVAFDPDQLTSKQTRNESIQGFDLVYRINMHRAEYIGGEAVKVARVPQEVISTLEGVRGQIGPPRIGNGPLINCCVEEGLAMLEDSTVVEEYRQRKANLAKSIASSDFMGEDLKIAGIIGKYFNDNPITLNDGSTLGYERAFSIKMPDEIRSNLAGVAKGLGVGISLVIVVCLMEVLSRQEKVNKEYKKRWKEALVEWRDGMKLQLRVGRKLMELVE